MSRPKISNDYQDGYDLGYKKGYVDGAKDYQPKKGKWIRLDNGSYMCSKCYENDYPWKDYKYCPNCGADMRGDV